MQRGISIDEIARRTKVSVDLWAGLERNDFSRWPTGIFARAYIREYSHAIGVDPEATVDEFCRCFPQGDRRAERIVRGQAEIVGHSLQWSDDLAIPDRRGAVPSPPAPPRVFSARARTLIAAGDVAAMAAAALLSASLLPIGFWAALAIVALLYHVCSLAALGASPAVALADWYVTARQPASGTDTTTLRLLRGSERLKI